MPKCPLIVYYFSRQTRKKLFCNSSGIERKMDFARSYRKRLFYSLVEDPSSSTSTYALHRPANGPGRVCSGDQRQDMNISEQWDTWPLGESVCIQCTGGWTRDDDVSSVNGPTFERCRIALALHAKPSVIASITGDPATIHATLRNGATAFNYTSRTLKRATSLLFRSSLLASFLRACETAFVRQRKTAFSNNTRNFPRVSARLSVV